MEKLKKFLLNHWTVIVSMIIGAAVGMLFPEFTSKIVPVGKVYIKLLILCSIIMLPTIIISSIGKIATAGSSWFMITKILSALFLTFFAISLVGILTAYVLSPVTAPDDDTRKSMGQLITKSQYRGMDEERDAMKAYFFIKQIESDSKKSAKSSAISDMIVDFFPENIFHAMAENETIKILIFSIVFGLILKYMNTEGAASIIKFMDNIFEVFNEFLMFLLYFLPLCIIPIIGEQTMGLDFHILQPLVKLTLLLILMSIVTFVICILIIRFTSGKPFKTILKVLKEPMFLSFIAENTLLAIPSMSKGMGEELGFCPKKVNLTVPLWLSFESHINILFMAAVSIFVIQLYSVQVTFGMLLTVLFLSVVAGLSSIAVPSPVWVAKIAIVLTPLGLPAGPVILALFLIEPFFGNLFNLINAVISCAAASILSRNGNSKEITVMPPGLNTIPNQDRV